MVNHSNRNKLSPDKWPEYLRRFREKHDLSQVDLADYLMISRRVVENWEMKINEPPAYLKYALFEVERKILHKAEHAKQIDAIRAEKQ